MPETTAKHRPPATHVAAKAPAKPRHRPDTDGSATPLDRTTKLSEDVLRSVEAGQRAAIDAVRTFVDTVDRALPSRGEGPSKRQEILDSALEMADRLVHTQYDFIRKVIDSASKTLGGSDESE
jgi:hypothetical protein